MHHIKYMKGKPHTIIFEIDLGVEPVNVLEVSQNYSNDMRDKEE